MVYFLQQLNLNKSESRYTLTRVKTLLVLKDRLKREVSKLDLVKFSRGDILNITFWKNNIIYKFEGICISLKKKTLIKPDVSFVLRNIILGVGVEFIVSYFYNRVYNIQFSDYKRKRFIYIKSKLYYLRLKLNKQSKIFA